MRRPGSPRAAAMALRPAVGPLSPLAFLAAVAALSCRSGASASGGEPPPAQAAGEAAEASAGARPEARAAGGASAETRDAGATTPGRGATVDTQPQAGAAPPGPPEEISLVPEGGGGIGFDDLGFARNLGRILAPAGASGALDVVDPVTKRVTAIAGLSPARGAYHGGHGEGTTSADEGRGLLFATDRTARKVYAIDPDEKTVVASAPLADGPDYVRWVDATSELWVTEPHAESIEVFTLSPPGQKPALMRSRTLRVAGGPESLVVDSGRRRAYTHLWRGSSVAIDVGSHKIVGTWPNGCGASRGIALDEARGFLFAACADGALSVLDVDQGGKPLGSVRTGAGVDVIAYSPSLEHVYVPGAESATMAIVGISAEGRPAVLATVPTVTGAHCVAADDRGQAWVCDPDHGRLLVFRDGDASAH